MCPLRKSLTNWQFSARSWASLVPSASISDKSLGLDGSGNAHDKTYIFLGDEENNTLTTTDFFSYLRTSSSPSSTITPFVSCSVFILLVDSIDLIRRLELFIYTSFEMFTIQYFNMMMNDSASRIKRCTCILIFRYLN